MECGKEQKRIFDKGRGILKAQEGGDNTGEGKNETAGEGSGETMRGGGSLSLKRGRSARKNKKGDECK